MSACAIVARYASFVVNNPRVYVPGVNFQSTYKRCLDVSFCSDEDPVFVRSAY